VKIYFKQTRNLISAELKTLYFAERNAVSETNMVLEAMKYICSLLIPRRDQKFIWGGGVSPLFSLFFSLWALPFWSPSSVVSGRTSTEDVLSV